MIRLITVIVFASLQQCGISERIYCEPRGQNTMSKFWMENYNLTKTRDGFINLEVHLSNFVVDRPIGDVERNVEADKAHFYYYVLNRKKAGELLPFRSFNFYTMWSFYSGDSLVFHLIDPLTEIYSRHEIGFHTNQYAFVIEPNITFAVDFPDHKTSKVAVGGVTLVKGSSVHPTSQRFFYKDEMMRDFPQHSGIINDVYKDR